MNKLLLLLCMVSSSFSMAGEEVIIIGAGLSGLTTAYRLKKLGYNVKVYEARKRPGGGVYTCYFPTGHSELGGMNIYDGGEGKSLKALADELKIPCYEYPRKRDFSYYSSSAELKELKDIFSDVPGPTQDLYNKLKQCASLGEVLDTLLGKQESLAKTFLSIRSRLFEGCDSENLSMFYFDSFWSYYCFNYKQAQTSTQMVNNFCTIKDGMSKLVQALCTELNDCIEYEMPLTKISHDEKSLQVKVGNKQVVAQKLILTIPCSTLRDVEIQEGVIPSDQVEMINTLQYGTNAKILIPTQGVSSRTCGAMEQCFTLQEDAHLWLYFGGKTGVFDKSDLPFYFSKLSPAIHALYPELTFDEKIGYATESDTSFTQTNGPLGISWINEPYSRGSYSCLAPSQEKQYEQFYDYQGEKIRKPFRPVENRIYFAGEHTSLDNPVTMEGAVESGERAARMVKMGFGK